ncbi:TCR/Tet family MFS transporter [Lichenihabitans psoromatis]|uniref:TCR/Tet family MFS transporter n=1 Tax=Lichenihabitans psoromatis TaxID=2528642 RepID=UPI001035805B|nr:TCR/Tet family MFS transporter [Lichenihabitans psoromatis]
MSHSSETPAPSHRLALSVVLASVLLDMVGIGIVVPVLPEMIRAISGSDISQASVVGGWLFVAYSAMQFLCGPAIGNLSDAFGRRPVLLASILGLGLDYIVTAFAPSVGWLFVGRIIAGICGASYTTANAYIADITPPEGRAKAFGLIGAAFGIGFILGPAIGGLLGQFGHKVPFLAAAACSLLNFAFGYFVLPESLQPDMRRRFRWSRASPFGAVAALRRQPALTRWAIVLLLFFLAQAVYVSVWAYSAIARYGWSEAQIGISLALVGITSALVQGLLVAPIIRRIGERNAALIGVVAACLSAIGYMLASEGWMVYALIILGAIQGLAMPAINALMSHEVPAEAQGELQGAVASVQSLASILGPLLMTQIFAAFTAPGAPVLFPGAPFAAAAVLFGASTLLLLRTSPRPGAVA